MLSKNREHEVLNVRAAPLLSVELKHLTRYRGKKCCQLRASMIVSYCRGNDDSTEVKEEGKLFSPRFYSSTATLQ